MNDQLIMENYLLILKSTVEVFVHGTLESSNENVRKLLKENLDETMKHQEDTYNIMTRNGWYTITNVPCSTVTKTLTKIKNKKELQ